jgi:PilZ domain
MIKSADKRRSRRGRSLLQGRIIFNSHYSVLECTILDVSETGARITFAHPIQIPQEFELDIPKRGSITRTQVVWSRGREHGVRFIKDTVALGVPSPIGVIASHPAAQEVQKIVEEARQRIADLVQVPVGTVNLMLDVNETG